MTNARTTGGYWRETLIDLRAYLWVWEHFAPEDRLVARALAACDAYIARPDLGSAGDVRAAGHDAAEQWWTIRERSLARVIHAQAPFPSPAEGMAEHSAGVYAMLIENVANAIAGYTTDGTTPEEVRCTLSFLRRHRREVRSYYAALGHRFPDTSETG